MRAVCSAWSAEVRSEADPLTIFRCLRTSIVCLLSCIIASCVYHSVLKFEHPLKLDRALDMHISKLQGDAGNDDERISADQVRIRRWVCMRPIHLMMMPFVC